MRRGAVDREQVPWPMCMSAVEKVLLKQGFVVADWFDREAGAQMTRAAELFSGFALNYVKPVYFYPDRDRAGELARALGLLAAHLGCAPATVAALLRRELEKPPPGFACLRCGACCGRFADAYNGRVTAEEVAWWRALGQEWILRFVREEKRPRYSLYRAWVNPRTGEYLSRCPWLRRASGGEPAACRIHAIRPLRCRAFPLTLEQAERIGCPGAFSGARPCPKPTCAA